MIYRSPEQTTNNTHKKNRGEAALKRLIWILGRLGLHLDSCIELGSLVSMDLFVSWCFLLHFLADMTVDASLGLDVTSLILVEDVQDMCMRVWFPKRKYMYLRLMAEILHQLIGSLCHFCRVSLFSRVVQGFSHQQYQSMVD